MRYPADIGVRQRHRRLSTLRAMAGPFGHVPEYWPDCLLPEALPAVSPDDLLAAW